MSKYKSPEHFVAETVLKPFREIAASRSRVLTVGKLQLILSDFLLAVANDFEKRMAVGKDGQKYPSLNEELKGTYGRPHGFAHEVQDGPPRGLPADGFYGDHIAWPVTGFLLYEKYGPEMDWVMARIKGYLPAEPSLEDKTGKDWHKKFEKELGVKESFWVSMLERLWSKSSEANEGVPIGKRALGTLNMQDRQLDRSRSLDAISRSAKAWGSPSVAEELKRYNQHQKVVRAVNFYRWTNLAGDWIEEKASEGTRIVRELQSKLSVELVSNVCTLVALSLPAIIYPLAIKTNDNAKRQRARKVSRRNK